jgi:hypothetical protein
MFYVIYPSKNISLKMATTGSRKMYEATLLIIQHIHIPVYATYWWYFS